MKTWGVSLIRRQVNRMSEENQLLFQHEQCTIYTTATEGNIVARKKDLK